jgi:hypothetical protein
MVEPIEESASNHSRALEAAKALEESAERFAQKVDEGRFKEKCCSYGVYPDRVDIEWGVLSKTRNSIRSAKPCSLG